MDWTFSPLSPDMTLAVDWEPKTNSSNHTFSRFYSRPAAMLELNGTVIEQSRKRGTSCAPDRERKQDCADTSPNVASAGFTVRRIRLQRYAIHLFLDQWFQASGQL